MCYKCETDTMEAIGTSKKKSNNKGVGSLAEYMTQLLNMPANDEEREQFEASGYKGTEVNQALLLAQAVLEKAIEKGDVSAFKEVRALLSEESGDSGELEKMVSAIKKSLKKSSATDLCTMVDADEGQKGKSEKKKGNKALAQEPE